MIGAQTMIEVFSGHPYDSIGIRLPVSMKTEIRNYANQNSLTVSDVVRRGVRKMLKADMREKSEWVVGGVK